MSINLTKDDLSYGQHVYLNMRTRVRDQSKEALKEVHARQRAVVIDAKSAKPYETPDVLISEEKVLEIRTTLLEDIKAGRFAYHPRMMGSKDFVVEQPQLYACAYDWGGLPYADAAYTDLTNESTPGKPSSVTIEKPNVHYDKGCF